MPRTTDHRLRRSSDFDRVSHIGKGRANDLVVLRYAPNDVDAMRAGYAVSKRVGGAVTRNAVKRRLRAAVRKLGPRESGVDLVFIARPQITQADYRGIEDAVADVLKRAGLRT
ncbi:MAG: ribonuclease P protein component [Dehalococcoidia bacterium]|nr:ribonuclease P protein component [Dehalococcoidia bacterium]